MGMLALSDTVGLWVAVALLPLSLIGALALSLLPLLDVDVPAGGGRARRGGRHAP